MRAQLERHNYPLRGKIFRKDMSSVTEACSLGYNYSSHLVQQGMRRNSTHERLLRSGHPDPFLVVLYHNFGRYLLLSCSRPGLRSLPATLQGRWNPSFQSPWGSKYTVNINTQMNYWPANVCNLVECEEPLFEHLHRVAECGKRTAEIMYGCRGWAGHHNTDICADTDPQ
jgi:hypothetical protein